MAIRINKEGAYYTREVCGNVFADTYLTIF